MYLAIVSISLETKFRTEMNVEYFESTLFGAPGNVGVQWSAYVGVPASTRYVVQKNEPEVNIFDANVNYVVYNDFQKIHRGNGVECDIFQKRNSKL